jgi:hypothetical protein
MQISSISVIKTTERKTAMWLVNLKLWVCWLEFVKILIFITVDIFKHTAKKKKKIKRADQILPEVYGTTLRAVNSMYIYIYLINHNWTDDTLGNK